MSGQGGSGGGPARRLRHRVPRSLRQHWKIVAAFVAFVVVMTTVFGGARIRPYITGDASVISSEITENITGTVDLFDESVTHDISVDISDAEYQDMIDTYKNEGEKDWVSAEVTIDGTVINDVAVRLKGNSTLRSLRSDPMPPMGAPGGAAAEAGGAQPDRRKETAEGEQPAGAAAGPGAAQQAEEQGERGPRVVMTQLSENEPQTLPLLLSFDQYAEGRAYQGRTEISIRPGTPMLNEAVALEVTAQSGQASQQYTYTVYSVNDSPTTTRLVVEHPDQAYADSLFDGNGVLYKVKAGSVFRYQGDDQTTYSEQFKQINGQGSADLQPIISLLKWLDEADTTRFEAELGDWVDTESLARYLATQHLFANFDDMGGPGANLYLWYNLDTGKFTVVSWDLNLALTGESTAGPHEDIGMAMPGAPADSAGAEQAGPPSGAPHAIGNQLKDRFLDSAAFRADYETAYRDLYEQFYRGGKASDITRKVGATVPLSESLAQEALDTAITELEQLLRARSEALSSSEVLIAE